jgi:hypothetical protein
MRITKVNEEFLTLYNTRQNFITPDILMHERHQKFKKLHFFRHLNAQQAHGFFDGIRNGL